MARLAGLKWPEQLQVVAALPRNPMGKILKREIAVERGAT